MTVGERTALIATLRAKLDKSRLLGDGYGDRIKAIEAELLRVEAEAPDES